MRSLRWRRGARIVHIDRGRCVLTVEPAGLRRLWTRYATITMNVIPQVIAVGYIVESQGL